jgi:serine/threonine protein kinase
VILLTQQYADPESRSVVQPSADIFSLGVILYELATGTTRPPDPSNEEVFFYQSRATEAQIADKLSAFWKPYAGIIFRAVKPNPEDRYQSVEEMISDFREAKRSEVRTEMPAGKYELSGPIIRVEGGFSEVYKGVNALTREPVALKFGYRWLEQTPELSAHEAGVLRYLTEAGSPYSPRFYDHDFFGGRPRIAMEWIEGETLHHFAQKQTNRFEELRERFTQLLEAVRFLHTQGVILRDLKPGNVIVSR